MTMRWRRRASSVPWGARVSRPTVRGRRRYWSSVLFAAAGWVASSSMVPRAAGAEPRAADKHPRFLADVVSRLDPRGEPGVVALIQICADGLRFEREGDRYLAMVEISLIAYDKHDRQVTGDTWLRHVVVGDYDGTTADTLCLLETPRLPVPAGEYRVAVGLADRRTGERSRLEFRVQAGGQRKGRLRFHDPLFRAVSADRGLLTGPVPSRRYGEESLEVVAEVQVSADDRNAPFARDVLVGRYVIEDANGQEVAQGDVAAVPDGDAAALPATFAEYRLREPLSELTRGVYTLRIEWSGDALEGGRFTQRGEFEVRASRLFWLRDYFATVEALRYIATPDEMRQLLGALPEERRARWHQFWKRRDPSPGTRRNEWEEEYLRRVAHANREFGNVRQTGWQSDRGRVYILHGPPDEVQRSVAPDGSSSETWHYFQDGRRFVFVDQSGLGDYRLRPESG